MDALAGASISTVYRLITDDMRHSISPSLLATVVMEWLGYTLVVLSLEGTHPIGN